MIINSDFLFIHIPKTGGMSIEKGLAPFNLSSRRTTGNRIARRLGIKLSWNKAYFKRHDTYKTLRSITESFPPLIFSVVRDPYAHALSHYYYMKQLNTEYSELARKLTLEEFLIWRLRNRRNDQRFPNLWFSAFHDQFSCIENEGALAADRILRLENIKADWRALLHDVGIPHFELEHQNMTSRPREGQARLSITEKRLIQDIYRRDFELFNY